MLLAALLIAAVIWLIREGRDRRYVGSSVDPAFGTGSGADERVPLVRHEVTPVEFVPPDDIRPAQIGVLVNFRARPRDVTATIVDLAVRGHLRIAIPQEAGNIESDWKLTRIRSGGVNGNLLPYERFLLDAVFVHAGEVWRRELRVIMEPRMVILQREIVDDAMASNWFAERPDTRRRLFFRRGAAMIMGGLALTWLLGQTTHDAAILGVPVIVAGVLVQLGGFFAPRRTAKGFARLRRVEGFRHFIVESEGPRANLTERDGLFSEYLAYAVVFRATARWARMFGVLQGNAPDTSFWFGALGPIDTEGLVRALDGFVTTTTGTLASPRRT